MRRLARLILLILPVVLLACDDGSPPVDQDGAPPAPDSGAPDAAPSPDTYRGPWANVYPVSPIVDNKQTTEVELEHITDAKGYLTGTYAEVWNCLPEPGGNTSRMGTWCHLRQQAEPGADGSYLHIVPPSSDVDGKDSFAEVMMYHHIDALREHYSSAYGLTHLDQQPVYAVVNLQTNVLGQWMGFPNAAYSPEETPQLLSMIGVTEPRDAIIFGFNNGGPMGQGMPLVNFGYDASVIYHEYTHYTIGGQALHSRAVADKHGLSPTPLALNEALADYMPASFLDDPQVGVYALADHSRDLTEVKRCPGDFHGESHTDGRIASGALWEARKILGASVLDQALWNAVLTFNADTSFEEAAVAFLDEIKQVAPDKHDAVKAVFEDRGLKGCVRLADHADFTADPLDPTTGAGYAGPTTSTTSYTDGLPAYVQYRVAVQEGTQEVTIEYQPVPETGFGLGNVWVALKPGSDPVLYDYTSGSGEHDAHVVLKGEAEGNKLKLVLSGDCVAKGDLVFLFLNKGVMAGTLNHVAVTQSTTKTNTTDNFTGCSAP